MMPIGSGKDKYSTQEITAFSNRPDFEGARHYARTRLERELAPMLVYHSAQHTRDDVVPAARRLALVSGLAGEDMLLVLTAAWFHDIGFTEQHTEHERVGVRIARDILPSYGYSHAQVDTIAGIIMATRLPQTPHNLLEEIMADADLDSLGRDDFIEVGGRLRIELAFRGVVYNEQDWWQFQAEFLEGHRYFTSAAQSLRRAGKQRNLARVRDLLSQYGQESS